MGAVYVHAVGGAAPLLADTIVRTKAVHLLDELGVPEAFWEFEVDGFTGVVTIGLPRAQPARGAPGRDQGEARRDPGVGARLRVSDDDRGDNARRLPPGGASHDRRLRRARAEGGRVGVIVRLRRGRLRLAGEARLPASGCEGGARFELVLTEGVGWEITPIPGPRLVE